TLPAYSVASAAGQPLNSQYVFTFIFLPGDANKDGVVNSLDFDQVAQHFGMSGQNWQSGDFNYDHVVNALDFNCVASDFGVAISSAPLQSAMLMPAGKTIDFFAGQTALNLAEDVIS